MTVKSAEKLVPMLWRWNAYPVAPAASFLFIPDEVENSWFIM